MQVSRQNLHLRAEGTPGTVVIIELGVMTRSWVVKSTQWFRTRLLSVFLNEIKLNRIKKRSYRSTLNLVRVIIVM